MKGMTGGVLAFVILVILVASVTIPVVIGANTTAWDTNTKSIWTLVPLALALVVLIAAFRMTGAA
jgi:hypothetical protein